MDFFKGPIIMGVVNVTPDSFSDGGEFLDPQKAIDHGHKLIEEGADILDLGGESTRPGAEPVGHQEEMDRVLPVIEGLKDEKALISIDTRHTDVMREALKAGAGMINDVNALRDEGAVELAAKAGVPVCLMHMQGNPETMQKNPQYQDVIEDVYKFLKDRVQACLDAGMDQKNIIIDPGIGFGKTLDQNLILLKNIKKFSSIHSPILLGTSRKSFIQKIDCTAEVQDRLPGSLASLLWGYQNGAQLFRVHDVKETAQALKVFAAIQSASSSKG